MESFNIVDLIENNPITTLSATYQNKLLTKIQEKFTKTEQQLFVSSFYCFLKYDSNTDFVIDLDDIWKWVGFSNKAHSKHLLERQFVIDKDYKLLLTKPGKQSDHTRGGHNKEIFMLNVSTFKKFCLKAGTKKADTIHDYYISFYHYHYTSLEITHITIHGSYFIHLHLSNYTYLKTSPYII